MNEYTKLDENTLGVVETKPEEVLPQKNYDLGFLKKQITNITAQRDEMIALKNQELEEVNKLLAESEKLGISESNEEIITP